MDKSEFVWPAVAMLLKILYLHDWYSIYTQFLQKFPGHLFISQIFVSCFQPEYIHQNLAKPNPT